MAQWQEIATLPEYQQLDIPSKRKVLNNYISNNFGRLKEFQTLPLEHKTKLQFQMEKTAGIAGIDNPFEQPQPTLTATPEEIIPRPIPQPLPPPTRQEQLAKESTDYGFNLLTGTASEAGKEAYGLAKNTFSPFDIRNATDPIAEVISRELMSGKPPIQAYKDMGKGLAQTGYDTLQGLSRAVGDPLGTTDIASGDLTFPTARQAWTERPYESAVGVSPILAPLLMKGIGSIPRRQPEVKLSPEAKQAYTEGIKEIGQTLKNIPDEARPAQARVVADLRNQMRSALFKDDISTINSIVADFREGQTIPTAQPPAPTLNIPEINATTLREKKAAIQARQKTVIPETPEYQAEMAKLMQQQNTDEFPFGENAPATIPEGLVEAAQTPPNIFARIKEFASGIKIDRSLTDHDIKGKEIYKLNQKQGGFFNYKPNSVTLDEAAQVLRTTTDDIVQQFQDALSKKEMNANSLAEVQRYVLEEPQQPLPKPENVEIVKPQPKGFTPIEIAPVVSRELLTSKEAQKAIDDFTDILVNKYGEESALNAPIFPEEYKKYKLPVPKTPVSEQELRQLENLYTTRDAIDSKDFEVWKSTISKESKLPENEMNEALDLMGFKDSSYGIYRTSKDLKNWTKEITYNLEKLYNHFAHSDIPYQGSHASFKWGGTGEKPILEGKVFDEDLRKVEWNIEALEKTQDAFNAISKTQGIEPINLLNIAKGGRGYGAQTEHPIEKFATPPKVTIKKPEAEIPIHKEILEVSQKGKPKFSQSPLMEKGEKTDVKPTMEAEIQGQQKMFNPKGEIVKESLTISKLSPIERAREARNLNILKKKAPWIDKKLTEGYIPEISKPLDTASINKLEKEFDRLREKVIIKPDGTILGNENRPEAKRIVEIYNLLKKENLPTLTKYLLREPIRRTSFEITKTEYGYAQEQVTKKGEIAKEPTPEDLDRLRQRQADISFSRLEEIKGQEIPYTPREDIIRGIDSDAIVSEPKAGMLRHGEEIPKYVESLNVSHVDENYDVKKLMTDLVSFGGYEKQTKTFPEIHKAGQELGITEESILKNAQKFPELSGKLDAMRQVAVDTSLKTHLLMKEALKIAIDKTLPQETRDKALIVANMQRDKAAAVMSATLGEISDSGRALGVLRRKAQGYKAMKNHAAMLKSLGGREINLEILERYANIDPSDIRAVSQFTLSLQRAKIPEMIVEAWKSAILSSPPTHAANAFNNAVNFLLKQTETGVSAGMQAVKYAVTGKPRLRFFGELKAEHIGAWQGLKEGMKEAIQTFKNEMAPDINKVESPRRYAIPSKRVKIFGKIFIIGGKQVRLPLRLLLSADELAKGVIYRAEMNAEAYRIASREGKRGKERAKRATELLNNPLVPERKAMEELAHNEGLYRTLNKPLGKWGNQIMRLRDTQIGESGFRPLEYIMPFVRTPTNAVKMSLEYTPLNFAKLGYETYKGDLKNEAITNEFAKPFIGSIIIGGLITYIMEGYITGKSEDEKIPSYSIKIGGSYYQYNRNDTLGSLIGITADYTNILTRSDPKNKESIAGELTTAFTRNFTNKAFFMGLSNMIKAIDDPTRYGENWINRLSGSVVPGFVNTVTKTLDTTRRQVETPLDAIKSRLPGLSKDLFPARDRFGDTKESSKLNAITPFYITYDTKDSVDNELIRLKKTTGFEVGKPQRRIRNIDLNQTQYDRYLKESGRMAKDRLKSYIKTGDYKTLADEDKVRDIENIINHSRREIANKMFFELRK